MKDISKAILVFLALFAPFIHASEPVNRGLYPVLVLYTQGGSLTCMITMTPGIHLFNQTCPYKFASYFSVANPREGLSFKFGEYNVMYDPQYPERACAGFNSPTPEYYVAAPLADGEPTRQVILNYALDVPANTEIVPGIKNTYRATKQIGLSGCVYITNTGKLTELSPIEKPKVY
ncbi:hypothetical protein [Pseudomonas chlororaphis]|uniref:hypothetical protein n=1 Tax=Pseudomonas chlororaphis TaxID=587753 RepID=UPI0015DD78B9|nr:hypothetical protein [Pseudomonas chlororaphis]QLL10866.1 hypothetical protein H0I86_17555 [Pseudomonas chlororaphis subsp. aurantiaca]